MHVNYSYLLDFIVNNSAAESRSLDFGCGDGQVIDAARKLGLDVYGAEVFQYGDYRKEAVVKKGYLGNIVREIEDHDTQFDDQFFDIIVNNQVFEHIADYDSVISELCRIAKPGAEILSIFPTRDVWIDGHTRIPFAHRMVNFPKLRYSVVGLFRILGMGRSKMNEKNPFIWAKKKCNWLDHYTAYRSRKNVMRIFDSYFSKVESKEMDYILYRLKQGKRTKTYMLMKHVRNLVFLEKLIVFLFRKRVGVVFIATK